MRASSGVPVDAVASIAVHPRTVVITGASRGLGLASATLLYRRGWRVVAAVRNVDEGLRRLRDSTGAASGDPRLLGVPLDLADMLSIANAASLIEALVGAPDVLIHNAGIAAAGSVEDTPVEVWRQLFETNVFGPVTLTKALLPGMRAAGRGRIIAVSSQVAIRGMPCVAPYSASKSAFERWAESLAAEVAPFGIGVTVFVTGAFKTEILTDRTPDYADPGGRYTPHYRGIRKAGGAMVEKAGSPDHFAHEMARAAEDTCPFVKKAIGIDAHALSWMARLLSGKRFHALLVSMMGLPSAGALTQSATEDLKRECMRGNAR